ncbi:fungal-specific transcription factor domain-containing protein [Mycena rosella]|uniref:Fungal-specific transcription factor domain-containing protein n=1 Tax=Mycena rosella TaxID=1033263 RepID=A0AAD7G014_MYCRO|nr:fungal-specific transcription factor domain-containing protein [Mycena rosella]
MSPENLSLNPAFSTLTQQEKVNIKRTSGKAPCAECKRLKLKCDKSIPCASCVRRGCGETCPTGTYLPTGRGKRAVPTEASRLKNTVSEMEARIKELETAITTACGYHLDYCPHLGISATNVPDQLAERLGALSINNTGNIQYFGPSAGTEALLSIDPGDPVIHHSTSTLTAVTEAFTFGIAMTWNDEQALTQLFVRLPSKPRAWQLCEVYFENGCWSGTPIMREELVELISQIYGTLGSDFSTTLSYSAHQMAVLYGVFALGALVDLTLPPYNAEADYYFDLCRAAMCVRSIFDHPSVATVQALVLLSLFHSHGGARFSMDGAWSMISMASNVCQNMGLHTGRLQLSSTSKQIQRQRALFWETYSIETLMSLAVGRPPHTSLANISCPFPSDDEKQIDDAGSIRGGYYLRRWQFVKEIAVPVMEVYLMNDPPVYAVVVDLDQRIRKFMQSTKCTDLHSEDDLASPAHYIQRRMIQQSCAIMLMYIHNNSFVLAMRENPEDPYYTSRATSWLSADRCASEIIRGDIENFTRHPELFSRWWPVWKSLFNAAIIVGAIAIKSPQLAFAPQAILELFAAVDLFERGAVASSRARSALTVLRKLRISAVAAYSEHAGQRLPDAESDATLDVFAGHTRIISQTILAHDRCRDHVPPIYPTPPGTDDGDSPPPDEHIDPSLVQYFSSSDSSDLPKFDGANAGAVLDSAEDTIMPPYFLNEPQWTEFLQDL